VVSVGDALYNFGVESFKDPKPRILFEDIFKMDKLGLDWYSVLGNHDCMGNIPATYALAKKFPYWKQSKSYYHKIFNIGSSELKAAFVFLNGCELVCLTKDSPECYRGTRKNINFNKLQDQLVWFEGLLSTMSKDNSIIWKIVVVHHAIFSGGAAHGDNQDLIRAVLPLLKKYKIDLVLSGHDHNVQYLRMDMNPEAALLQQDKARSKDMKTQVKCPPGVIKDECISGEFFQHELTECGIVRKEEQASFMQNLYPGDRKHMIDLHEAKFWRESLNEQHDYLHQFVLGNGGTKMQNMCPSKQKESAGKLKYGNTVPGLADIKIKEDRIEVNLVSIKNELLYSVKIFRQEEDDS